MSAFPETRYVCDRCRVEVAVAIQNTPIHTRQAGAFGWLPITVGADPSVPGKHLCERCADLFVAFMAEVP